MPNKLLKFMTLAAVLIPFAVSVAQDGILVSVKIRDYPYADSHIADKLSLSLSPFENVQVFETEYPTGPPDGFDRLIALGRERKVRFLAELFIDRMDISSRKQTIVPLILYRYRIYGGIVGMLRIIDITKERVIQLENLKIDLKATDQWQIFDDDANDPALNIPADQKTALFDRLEDEVAKQFWEKVRRLTRGNSFGG